MFGLGGTIIVGFLLAETVPEFPTETEAGCFQRSKDLSVSNFDFGISMAIA